jgi:hypothetical protein
MNPWSSGHDGFISQELALSIVNYLCLTPKPCPQGFGFWNYYFYIIVIQPSQQRPLPTQSLDEVLTVLVVIDDPALFNPSEDNMVKGSGSIESRLAGQKTSFSASESSIRFSISYLFNLVNNVPFLVRE